MKKLYLLLFTVSSLSLYGMEQVQEALEKLQVIDTKEQPAVENRQSLDMALGMTEIVVNAIGREIEHGEWLPTSVADQIGSQYKDLLKLETAYPKAEVQAQVNTFNALYDALYEHFNILIDELEGQVQELQNAVLQYQAATDVEKVQQQPGLVSLHDAVVDRFNALLDTGIEEDLPQIRAIIVEARRAVGIE